MSHRGSLEFLSDVWRTRAKSLRRYGSEAPALALEACAAELEAAWRESDSTVLTLTAAARESGYSADHLGRLVREGKIPNAGRRGAPKIALKDLPRKARRAATGSDRVEEPPPREASGAEIVQSIIDNRA